MPEVSDVPVTLPLDTIVVGDSAKELQSLPASSVHLILSDIPYGIGAEDWDVLHDNTNSAFLGSSPAQEKAGAIFRKRGKPINGWSEADRAIPRQYYEWCSGWAPEWLRALMPGGAHLFLRGVGTRTGVSVHSRTSASHLRTCLAGFAIMPRTELSV